MQLARDLEEGVRSGRLQPGEALPGSRSLAKMLRVHRNTVLAGYNELIAKGWVVTIPGGGTFIASTLSTVARRPPGAQRPSDGRMGFDFSATPLGIHGEPDYPRGTLVLTRAVPDFRLLPVPALARVYRQALRKDGGRLLSYGDPRGERRLRVALAEMVSATRAIRAEADDVLITRGSLMGLHLAARALFSPGDTVAVEALGNRNAWAAFRLAGAKLVPVPVDKGGIRVDVLESLLRKRRLRALYVTPHHQFPTTVNLDATRRLRLLELAGRHRVIVLEDDYDHEFHYDTPPVLPLASADSAGVVLYFGTLSKVLAPGLRMGFAIKPRPVLARMAELRATMDIQSDRVLDTAVAMLMEEGDLPRHIRKMRRLYHRRRDAFTASLERHLVGALSFVTPAGGMALWAEVARDVPLDAWASRALEQGVAFAGAQEFAFDGQPVRGMRLGFSRHSEAELEEAARRMAAALRGVQRSRT